MKVLLTGGGTGGHIYPALAVAGYIREREPETQILYVGAKGGMEERLVPQAGFSFRSITISGFQRKLSLKKYRTEYPHGGAGVYFQCGGQENHSGICSGYLYGDGRVCPAAR